MKHGLDPLGMDELGGMPLLGRMYEVEAVRELETGDAPEPSAPDREVVDAAAVAALAVDTGDEKAHAEPPADFDGLPCMPFIGRIVDHASGESITVERPLTLSEDLHLADHAFVHAPGLKPLSACLPVLPMTMSLEMMAEVAACLAPGCGLIGLEDVKATRWIELADRDELSLRISAQHQGLDSEHSVHRIVASIYIAEQTAPAISACILFAPHYRLEVELAFTELAGAHRYPLSAEQIYEQRYLFHGPSYQCLVGDILLGDRGAVGELLVRSPANLFRGISRPQLLMDPTLLDAVGQLIGMWAMERDRYVFPIGISKLELYQPTPAAGTRVPIRVEIVRDEAKILHADIEVQDGKGAVWMRIRDWSKWKFRWEPRLLSFRRLPTRHLLTEPIALPSLDPAAVCQILTAGDLTGFDGGLLARFYLHLDEMPAFTDKAGVPQRQQQWLLGRIAAKDAVRKWLAARTGADEMLHPAAFAITSDTHGQPLVKHLPRNDPPPKVSIAHCEDRGIAVAHERAVGVDIERIAQRDRHFLDAISTERERALLDDLVANEPPNSMPEWITRLWCAKEAAGKLLGTGVDGAPQRFEATAIGADGILWILPRGGDNPVRAQTLRNGDFILAYAAE
jgi:phosphopantetheinyl transferase (holo-ACP synthase)